MQFIFGNRQIYSIEYFHKETKKYYDIIHYSSEKQKEVYAFFIDRTKEHLVKENNDNLKSLIDSILENLPIPFYAKEVGDDIRYTLWNKKAEEFFGKTAKEVIGKNDFEVFGKVCGEEIRKKEEAIIENGGELNYEEHILTNNEMRTSSVIKTLSKREGKLSHLIATRWDITELKNVQKLLKTKNQKLALALNIGNVIPLTWNVINNSITINYDELNLNNDFNNKKVERTYKYMFSILHPSDRESMETLCREMASGEKDSIDIDVRTNFRNEEYEWFRIKAWVSERNYLNQVSIVTGIAINISKTKQIEQTLINAKEKAEEASNLKSAFLSNINHEIRTPLNAIVGFSRIIASPEIPNCQKREFAGIIEHNNSLLLRIIDDLIFLADMDAGIMNIEYSEININTLLNEIAEKHKNEAEKKELNIHLERNAHICQIRSEKTWITQVLNNLISNALKFTDKGCITLGYNLNKTHIQIYVKDTGHGIPEDKQNFIFTRFTKLDLFKQGTGLGLALCKAIIQKLEGEIGVESELGKGSVFWFTLPLTNYFYTE